MSRNHSIYCNHLCAVHIHDKHRNGTTVCVCVFASFVHVLRDSCSLMNHARAACRLSGANISKMKWFVCENKRGRSSGTVEKQSKQRSGYSFTHANSLIRPNAPIHWQHRLRCRHYSRAITKSKWHIFVFVSVLDGCIRKHSDHCHIAHSKQISNANIFRVTDEDSFFFLLFSRKSKLRFATSSLVFFLLILFFCSQKFCRSWARVNKNHKMQVRDEMFSNSAHFVLFSGAEYSWVDRTVTCFDVHWLLQMNMHSFCSHSVAVTIKFINLIKLQRQKLPSRNDLKVESFVAVYCCWIIGNKH